MAADFITLPTDVDFPFPFHLLSCRTWHYVPSYTVLLTLICKEMWVNNIRTTNVFVFLVPPSPHLLSQKENRGGVTKEEWWRTYYVFPIIWARTFTRLRNKRWQTAAFFLTSMYDISHLPLSVCFFFLLFLYLRVRSKSRSNLRTPSEILQERIDAMYRIADALYCLPCGGDKGEVCA